MNTNTLRFITFIDTQKETNDKKTLEEVASKEFNLTKDRKVFRAESFAVRFCYSSSKSFSNTVLSLSALEKYDHIPFFVVLVRKNLDNKIYLANTTFIKKISHSSKELSINNIKGSFNGSDIIKLYDEINNCPENFEELFNIHQGFSWEDNLTRLVEATSTIAARMEKFHPTKVEEEHIFRSIERAIKFIKSKDLCNHLNNLQKRVNRCKNEIIIASRIENTNIRGRLIESLISSDDADFKRLKDSIENLEKELPSYNSPNSLGDYITNYGDTITYTDIKTKIIYLTSNPKGFNIDKFLRTMADPNSVFFLFFIGIDTTNIFNTALCSVYDKNIIDSIVFQYHWAGRASRGATQFRSTHIIENIINVKPYRTTINEDTAKEFIEKLLRR